jgi:hypothetical protein
MNNTENMRKMIQIVEYRQEKNYDMPEDNIPEPNLSQAQKSLVKAMYETDEFTIDKLLPDIIKMTNL